MTAITEPGVYDLPADEYLADPVEGGSLSSSGARKLLPPSCPAKFHHERQHPSEPTGDMEFGTIAHKEVLGIGPELAVIDAKDWRTKKAQQEAADARQRGAIPLLAKDYQSVQEMAKAIRNHPYAAALFSGGRPEQTLVWRDEETGVMCRALVDWLRDPGPGRMLVPDYKTTKCAHPDELAKSVFNFGYYQQAAWYLAGVRALGLGEDPQFLLACQEKTPPYLITIAQPDAMALRIGEHRNRQALQIYRDCKESGVWPGYSGDVVSVPLPAWAENRYWEEIQP